MSSADSSAISKLAMNSAFARLDTSKDEAICTERASQFIKIRSMSNRPVSLWSVVQDTSSAAAVIPEMFGIASPRSASDSDASYFFSSAVVGGVSAGTLPAGGVSGFSAKEGEEYFLTIVPGKDTSCGTVKNPLSILGSFKVTTGKTLYEFFEDPKRFDPSYDDIEMLQRERDFMGEYERENGRPWIHHYGFLGPRAKPSLHMWDTDKGVDTTHTVITSATYWKRGVGRDIQESGTHTLTLQAVATSPRVFLIENFISDFEADTLIKQASPHMANSIIGSPLEGMRESFIRTSTNTWLDRESSHITETIYDRAADVLGIPRRHIRNANNVEDLQVVHYKVGQKYNAHYDFVVDGMSESRFITLLIYLSDMASPSAGGETAFPKALLQSRASDITAVKGVPANTVSTISSIRDDDKISDEQAEEAVGFKVRPVKGNAVLFYNLLEDGNGDERSLHAALPVKEGEKWLANLWVWDPKLPAAA